MRSHAKDGALNETMILSTLDKHYYKDLSDKWKRHMNRMFKDIQPDDYITVDYYPYKDAKPDLEIKVRNKTIHLSVKSGHSPTVHHERTYSFFQFLKDLDVPKRILRIMYFYHYGYSCKNPGNSHIFSREEILEKYPEYVKEVNEFFSSHEDILREIIYRTIIRGRLKRDLIDYFYYGNPAKGFLLSIKDIDRLITKEKIVLDKTVAFKSLTYVGYGRSEDKEKHNDLMIHWPVLCKWFYDKGFMIMYG